MKKRLVCILLVLLITAALLPVSAFATKGIASGTCGKNLTWVLDNYGTLTVSGTGDMYDYEEENEVMPDCTAPWANYYDADHYDIEVFIIEEGVTSIGAYAFWGCQSPIDVSIPKTVTKIDETAFYFSPRLHSIEVSPDNPYYSSKDGVLFNKDKTELLVYPAGKTDETYTVPASVRIIADKSFEHNTYLKKVNIPNGTDYIGELAFGYCQYIETVTIPASIKSIGNYAFRYCIALADVYYGGNEAAWQSLGIDKTYHSELSSAKKHYNMISDGWQKNSSEKWNYYKDGKLAKGWQQISGKWYYLGTDGIMVTGWKQVSGKWYYMNSSGVMQTGWVKSGTKWYYMNSSGVMQTGWIKSGGKWYYLDSNGEMVTGWKQVSGKWYYMNSSGVMQTGWVKTGGKWYYLNSNGDMKTGWLRYDGKWYYLKASGAMACNENVTVSGKSYHFDAAGICTNP